ncbi:MAG: T9SS type A sorting domain-containing protein, partial [Bacteroidota bacterium]|nr:T9SS type A sorting domain-containing protein [Bacteroidota bacterium]
GKVTVNGTVRTNLSSGLAGSNAAFITNTPQSIILNSGSTIDYYSSDTPVDQTISDLNYSNLTISGARNSKIINFPNILRIAGTFSPTATNATYNPLANTIEFNGGNQIIPSFNYYDVIISGTGDKVLGNTIRIDGTLNMVANKIDATDFNLILGPTATITGEAPGSYVVGKLSTTRTINGNGSDFGGMGFILGSGANMGLTTVTRFAGPNSSVRIEANNNEGINRRWVVTPGNQPTSPVSVTLSWLADDDNDKDLTAMRVWKTQGEDESKYYDVSQADQDASNRTITATVSSFSTLTVSDKVNPLPVELIAFDVVKQGRNAVLTWQTAMEKNNLGFGVEISLDAKNFKEVGFVKSLNSNSNTVQNYEFTHRASQSGTVYYRLKQTDWNGNSNYFGPKAIHFDPVTTVAVFPNPVTNNVAEVTVQAGGMVQEEVKITIIDALGKVVYRQTESKNPTRNELKVNVSQLPAGVYVITVSTPDNSSQTRIVKQ